MHCIAPGCANWFYKNRDKHFHQFPANNSQRSREWLQKLKRMDPPTHHNARVCSDHFTENDYISVGMFQEDGSFSFKQTTTLKDNAVPTMFDFSSYNPSATDAPTVRQSKLGSDNRKLRYTKHNYHTKAEEVHVFISD